MVCSCGYGCTSCLPSTFLEQFSFFAAVNVASHVNNGFGLPAQATGVSTGMPAVTASHANPQADVKEVEPGEPEKPPKTVRDYQPSCSKASAPI